jgi:hypothetical protein
LYLAGKCPFFTTLFTTFFTTFFTTLLPSSDKPTLLIVDELLAGVVELSIFRTARNHFQNSNRIVVSSITEPVCQFAQ